METLKHITITEGLNRIQMQKVTAPLNCGASEQF